MSADIGKSIKQIREQRDLNQRELAKYAGIRAATGGSVCRGRSPGTDDGRPKYAGAVLARHRGYSESPAACKLRGNDLDLEPSLSYSL